MSWKQLRLGAFSLLGSAFLLVANYFQQAAGGPVEMALLIALAVVGGALVLVVVGDVAYHTWRGEGQACRSCGHVWRMKPFRVYVGCPKCGKE